MFLDPLPQAELSSITGTSSHENDNGNSTAIGASAAASKPGGPLRIAFVGGRHLKDSQRKLLPPNAEVRLFLCQSGLGLGVRA